MAKNEIKAIRYDKDKDDLVYFDRNEEEWKEYVPENNKEDEKEEIDEEIKYLEKKDVKEILHIKDDSTYYKYMRVALRDGFASNIGRKYQITLKNLKKFMKHMEGQDYDF